MEALERLYEPEVPALVRSLVHRLVNASGQELTENAVITHQLIVQLHKMLPLLSEPDDPELRAALEAQIERQCPDNPDSCFSPEGEQAMFRSAPELSRRLANAAADQVLRSLIAPRLLQLIESQLPGGEAVNRHAMDSKALEIEGLGFKVVRVPYLVSLDPNSGWTGVSYVNSLVTDGMIFVPTFGLGKFEDQLLADLAKKLPAYRLIPVDSRYNISYNGGVHCTFGIVRAAESN